MYNNSHKDGQKNQTDFIVKEAMLFPDPVIIL